MAQYPDDKFPVAMAQAFDQRVLELILLPTEQCNFRCTYCYESFAVGRMSQSIQNSVKKYIDNRSEELAHLRLGWFGGEPTLAMDIIENISLHALACAREHKFHFSGSITTNGYLLDRHLTRLLGCGVTEYQISLDGPKSHHDTTRLRADRTGTFDRVWNNLRMMRDSRQRFHVMIRLHMTPANVESLYDFVVVLDNEFLGDSRFSVLFAPVEHLGGPGDDSLAVLTDAEQALHITGLRERMAHANAFMPAEDPMDLPYVCYAAKPNAYVVRATGVVCKCTVALDDPGNMIGRLTPEGRMVLDRDRYLPWLRGWQTRDASTLHCPLAELRHCEGCH